MKREKISKALRFEVFKRDSFKCQYCGASAPDVLLHVDHIHPVAKGGTAEITNLITACVDCNGGKSDRLLSDDAALKRQRGQLEEMQERRIQLEMMAEWHRSMISLKDQALATAEDLWGKVVGWTWTETARADVRKLIAQFGIADVLTAIPKVERYLVVDSGGLTTKASAQIAFGRLGGICATARRELEDPELHEIYKVRYSLSARLPSMQPWQVSRGIDKLRKAGFTAQEIRRAMDGVTKWYQFDEVIDALLDAARPHGE